jgi:hypothetical protein
VIAQLRELDEASPANAHADRDSLAFVRSGCVVRPWSLDLGPWTAADFECFEGAETNAEDRACNERAHAR